MKNILSKLFKTALVLPVAAALSACVNERTGESIQIHIIQPVTFNICEMQTRTGFGPGQDGVYPTLWTSNDAAVKLALNYTEAAVATVVPSEDFRSASFTADIDASVTQAPYTFYALSPASAARALSPSREAWSISIPAVQTPLEGSVDEAAMILAAASQPSDVVPQSVDIHFSHLTAYGRMSFANLDLGGAVVDRVEITATMPFVGDWYWDCNAEHSLTDNGASSTLTLRTSATSDIWFACAPVDLSGELLVFTVYTDQGAFVKEAIMPQGRSFAPGHIAVFSVDMSGVAVTGGGSDEFRLVTDTSDLQEGDELIIMNASENYAISTNQKTSNRAAAAVSVSNHAISDIPQNVQVLVLEAGSADGFWCLGTGSGYLANANGNSNKLLTVNSRTLNANWTISVASSGVATLKTAAGERNTLRFNDTDKNNLLFSCYSSGQKDVVIYRKGGTTAGPIPEDPLTEYTDYGFYRTSGSRIYFPGADQYCRRYTDEVQTFSIVDPANKEQLDITGYRKSLLKGDTVTITVNWRKGISNIVSSQNFVVTVVKEDGPRVWLGDGKGNGFIIKK